MVGGLEVVEMLLSPKPECSGERLIGSVNPSAAVVNAASSSLVSEDSPHGLKGIWKEGSLGRDGAHQ